MTRILHSVLWAALFLGGLGCDEDLPEITLIDDHMRVIGARMQVVDAPERSTPMPGERLTFTWETAYPTLDDDDGDLFSLFIVCTAPAQFTGIPVCQEFLDAAQTEQGAADIAAALNRDDVYSCDGFAGDRTRLGTVTAACVEGEPTTEVTVLPAFKGAEMLIRGVICQDGIPEVDPFDPLLFRCTGDARFELRVHAKVPVLQTDDDRNLNPSMADATFELRPDQGANRDWGALPPDAELPAEDDCAGSDLDGLESVDPALQIITIGFDPDAREDVGPDGEVIEFSAYTTAGELERRFAVFDPDDSGPLQSEIEWKPPKLDDIGSGGQLVRFFFTVIDRRGGFDLAERAVCVRL